MKISDAASQQILQLFSQYAGKSFSAGDSFTGRVLALVDGQLLLALADGTTVNAEVQNGSEYTPGQVLRLEVVKENQGRLFVKEMPQPGQAESVSTKPEPAAVLKALKLPADNDRMEVVRAMQEMDVKPDVSLIEKAAELLKARQVSEPRQAVFLVLNEMEQKESYFPLVKALDQQSFHFYEKWDSLLNNLTNLDDPAVVLLADRLVTEELLQQQDFSGLQSLMNQTGTNQLPENQIEAFKSILRQLLNSDMPENPRSTMNQPGTEAFETAARLFHRFVPEVKNLEKSAQDEIVGKLIEIASQLTAKKSEQPLTPEVARKVILQVNDELPSDILVKTSDNGLPKADRWLRAVDEKLEAIAGALTENGKASELLPEVREMQTAVRFFSDIVSYETFAQLPLLLKGNTTHGELYVMKRRGNRKKLNAEDFSLFLSLTTLNLGTIEAFVHVQKRNVLLRVAVDDEKFNTLLTDQYKFLYETLKTKGYRLYELKVVRREDRLNLFNAMRKAREIIEPDQRIDVKV